MKLDIDLYKVNKSFVQAWYLENADGDLGSAISLLACSTMCPCIVIAYWLGEVSNWHPDTIKHIKGLIKFYGYTEILNKPPGSPI